MIELWVLGAIVVATVFSAYGAVYIKLGTEKFDSNIIKQLRNWRLIGGLMLYLFSTVFYLIALKNGQLSIIYPLTSLSYIWVTILSRKILNERIGTHKWTGIICILIGTVLLTQ